MEAIKVAKLILKEQNKTLLADLKVANSFKPRLLGLIGTKSLSKDQGMWFPKSNWIHTCFMSMPIDVVYLRKNGEVKKIQKNLKPWRFPAPVFGAHSVLETGTGFIEKTNLKVGDTLYVGD
jgi:uncharacterized membrane protein (UPF0127 family)